MTDQIRNEWKRFPLELAKFLGGITMIVAILFLIQFTIVRAGILDASTLKWGGIHDVGMALGTAVLFIAVGLAVYNLAQYLIKRNGNGTK